MPVRWVSATGRYLLRGLLCQLGNAANKATWRLRGSRYMITVQTGRSTLDSSSLAEAQRLGVPLLQGLQPRAGCGRCQRVGQPTYRLWAWGCFSFPGLLLIGPSRAPQSLLLPWLFPSGQVAVAFQSLYDCCATSHAAFSGDSCLSNWSTEQ